MKIKTSGLDHVHVYVNDLTGLLELLDKLFECEQTQQSEIGSVGAYQSTVSFPGGGAPTFLDLFEPSDDTGITAKTVQRSGEGIGVLSFRVEDIDAAAEHAVSCGLREISRVGFPGVVHQVQFHPADTPGFMIEFVEYEEGAEEKMAEIQRRKASGEHVDGLKVRPGTEPSTDSASRTSAS